ncbi:MAG TPA: hypothetical protein DCW60_03005 [Sutterella sp.]|nr:hypothetical protein [Sutterella sp.]
MVAFFTELNWAAVFQIIAIDILLGGDNAVVIAMASRNLSPKARRGAIFWGVAGAIGLRVALITCAMFLLEIAGLKAVAGALLLWIGIKLLIEDDSPKDVKSEDRLWQAVKTIIIADFVMSLDNVIGIAGAAQAAADHHQLILVIFGLLVSIPFIVFGSQIILKLFTRFPVIVDLGGALLGWIGGTLLVGDTLLSGILPAGDATRYAAGIAGAVLVIAASKIILHARSRA